MTNAERRREIDIFGRELTQSEHELRTRINLQCDHGSELYVVRLMTLALDYWVAVEAFEVRAAMNEINRRIEATGAEHSGDARPKKNRTLGFLEKVDVAFPGVFR